MADKEIVDFVKKRTKEGFSFSEIKQTLLSQGYSDYEIDEVINEFRGKKKLDSEKEIKPIKRRGLKTFFGILFVLILVGIFLYFLITSPLNFRTKVSISYDKIEEGVNLELVKGSIINFETQDESYFFKINSINENSLSISGNLSENIPINSFKEFDLNQDGINDFLIEYSFYQKGKGFIYLKGSSNEEVCTESWICTEFGPCINSLKNKVCVDENFCGTEFSKPNFSEFCMSENNSNSSFVVPENYFDCGIEEVNYVNDCFLESALNCSSAQIISNTSFEDSGVFIFTNDLMRISSNSETKCKLYQETLNYSIKYSESYRQELLNSGMTSEEIDSQELNENELAQGLVGIWFECDFDKSDLYDVLSEWKQGIFNGGFSCDWDDSNNFNCYFNWGDKGIISENCESSL
ncbi:MAG: hypothetical protein WC812_00335 [Candidatus Pacearchaeota archaeon]|jgi:hypothetical protein